MASIERTAYPRFMVPLSEDELDQFYKPSVDELNLVNAKAHGDRQRLTFLVLLKTLQRLGYLPAPKSIPAQIILSPPHSRSKC